MITESRICIHQGYHIKFLKAKSAPPPLGPFGPYSWVERMRKANARKGLEKHVQLIVLARDDLWLGVVQ